jgi:hypothetical protein
MVSEFQSIAQKRNYREVITIMIVSNEYTTLIRKMQFKVKSYFIAGVQSVYCIALPCKL